jgi:plastocyanin
MKKKLLILFLFIESILGQYAYAEQFEIKGTSRGFEPKLIHIQPGDSVIFTNMISNNTVSVEGLIPQAAEPWNSRIGKDKEISFTEQGVYSYISVHSIQYGASGVIVVGEPVNLQESINFAENNMRGPYRVLVENLLSLEKQKKLN